MTKCSDTATGDTLFTGKGEFQIKNIYVRAEVEVCAGTISKIVFSSPSGDELFDVMTDKLKGQSVSSALKVNAMEADSMSKRTSENPKKVAMLEAFHRAVEACFDKE